MQKTKRFLPYRIKGKPGGEHFSREQVTKAILAFQARGGLIEKLPPERDNRRMMVGNRWGSMYEGIFDNA